MKEYRDAGLVKEDQQTHATTVLAAFWSDKVAHIWNVEDVLSDRPDLSREQALEVLDQIDDDLGCSVGITWDVLKDTAERLFPKG
jgi:hypothetical protein